ncbi:hypothetical protein F5Y08DRAFT_331351 [Xylaria arbuscula]|nr:hypothetical protein F5Y08DRAFT_331351 [Xylaria arbuscula]
MHTTKSVAGSLIATLVASALTSPVTQLGSVCTEETALKRKEWSALSKSERKEYIGAVECLMAKDSQYPTGEAPASNSYYTDFATRHAELALNVHMSGTFLSFHREFIHLLESSLHDCGYSSDMGLPYWDWPAYLGAPLNQSTLFDGSPSSLGGDGEAVPEQEGYPILEEGDVLPPGSGGGCVVEDPFANTTLYLGPFPVYFTRTGLPDDWTEKNPHCFTRNLNDAALQLLSNADSIGSLLNTTDIKDFQEQLNPIHRGGHIGVGGPMMDFFVSPLDPAFFLHHGQIDRLWTMWQAQDPTSRRYAYSGTDTFMDPSGAPMVSNSTTLDFGVLGDVVSLEEIANPMAGRYCYQYV